MGAPAPDWVLKRRAMPPSGQAIVLHRDVVEELTRENVDVVVCVWVSSERTHVTTPNSTDWCVLGVCVAAGRGGGEPCCLSSVALY